MLFNLQHHSRRGVVHSAPNRLDLRDVKVIILLYEQGGSVGGVISRRIGKICPPSGSTYYRIVGKRVSLGLGVADFLCSASSYTRPVFSLQNITTILIKQCLVLVEIRSSCSQRQLDP